MQNSLGTPVAEPHKLACRQNEKNGTLVLFLIHLHRRTHYIYFPQTERAASGRPAWVVEPHIDVAKCMSELAAFEEILCEDEVLRVWVLQVSGDATGGNIRMECAARSEISTPATVPKRAPDEDGVDDGDDDDIVVLLSDCEKSDAKVVGTDDESGHDSIAASDSTSDANVAATNTKAKAKDAAAGGFLKMGTASVATKATPLPLGGQKARSGLKPLWFDDFFWIADSPGDVLHIRVRERWRCPARGGGLQSHIPLSKHITPRHYGETRDDPTVCLFLLRAWSIWRARQGGWANAFAWRSNHFAEQESQLERDVAMYNAADKLLGNDAANADLRIALPQLCIRLRTR